MTHSKVCCGYFDVIIDAHMYIKLLCKANETNLMALVVISQLDMLTQAN